MNASTNGNGLIDRYLGNGSGSTARAGTSTTTSPTSPTPLTAAPAAFEAGERYVPMLSLELQGGNHAALPYSMLLAVKYDPSTGIELEFSAVNVSIKGRRLHDLYTAIVQHRASKIRCTQDDRFAAASDSRVTAIELDSPDGT